MDKKVWTWVGLVLLSGAMLGLAQVAINGAGGSFSKPAYDKWAAEFAKTEAGKGVTITYDGKPGSSGGITKILKKELDFAGSDIAITDARFKEANVDSTEIVHVPSVLGGVVFIYNIPGFGGTLKLSGETLAKIYKGEIKSWKDVPETSGLPNIPITPVWRSDGGGTTYVFTEFLSAFDKAFTASTDPAKNFKVGKGAEKFPGIEQAVKETEGAIGYVGHEYADEKKLKTAEVRNQAGEFVAGTLEAISKAAAGVKIHDDFRVSLVNPPKEAKGAYPVSFMAYTLVWQKLDYLGSEAKAKALAEFLWYLVGEKRGQPLAKELGYPPLPAELITKIETKLKALTFQGKALLK